MQEILQLAKSLAEKREQVRTSEHYLNGLKEEKEKLQFDLIEALQSNGLKSIKTNEANYSLTTKKDIKVTDENSVIEALKVNGQYDNYVKPKLDTIRFKGYATAMLKETGEVMEGTELTESTYISIKSAIQTA